MKMSELTVGSIWREADMRFSRYIKVVEIVGGTLNRVMIQTVCADDGRPVTGRTTSARADAFGKRYKFVRAA
jgi:hypothetical protein